MAKERISLTLDSELVDRIDRRLEQQGVTNRSRGIEQLLRKQLQQESVHDAVILAGGADANALIPINGRPVIDHILDNLEDAGVERIFIATGIRDLENSIDTDRSVQIEFVMEDEPLGTAGPLREIASRIKDTFLVMNGDVLCDVDVEDMKQAHEEAGSMATVALTTVGDSSEYGVIRMKGNQIVGFKEKPDESYSHLINAGIYLLEPALLDRIPDETEQQTVDIELLFEQLAGEGRLNGYVYDGEWREVGE